MKTKAVKIIWNNKLSGILDDQKSTVKFIQLYDFLCSFDMDAIEEWRAKRNFTGKTRTEIIDTLIFIKVLK
jgi:hypothetical protein